MLAPKRIVVARTDKLGDLLLSLPSLQFLRTALPQTEISFVCDPKYHRVVEDFLRTQEIRLESVETLWKEKASGFLSLYSTFGVAVRAFLKGVRVRVGQYSQPWSFVVYTSGIRQHRGLSEKNEMEYGLDLVDLFLSRFGVAPSSLALQPILLPVNDEDSVKAKTVLESLGVGKHFAVFHPGMFGSALNATPQNYWDLMEAVRLNKKLAPVLSLGPAPRDAEIVKKLLEFDPSLPVLRDLSLGVFKEVLRQTTLVVAPSTGPLHLAHYVGTEVFGIYSPVLNHHPRRWAPKGGAGSVTIGIPPVDCPGIRDCLGPTCDKYFCMEAVKWPDLLLGTKRG